MLYAAPRMKHLKLLSLAVALTMGASLHAANVLTSGSWDGAGQNLNDYFTTWGVALDVNADQKLDDQYWDSILSSGDSAVMLLEVAGHSSINTFGIFQQGQNGLTHTQIFNGAAGANASAILAVPTGPFGFYLEFQGTYFYSDASLNSGGYDQLATYRGPFGGVGTVVGQLWDENSYLLAWEDLPYLSSDMDYNDMVLMIRVQERQVNVPDSGATALMVLGGLATLVGLRRKLA